MTVNEQTLIITKDGVNTFGRAICPVAPFDTEGKQAQAVKTSDGTILWYEDHVEKWIDWKNSARAAEYAPLIERLYAESGPDQFELPASAVTKKLIHALESSRPRPRYYVTVPTHIAGIARRLLSTLWLDKLLGS